MDVALWKVCHPCFPQWLSSGDDFAAGLAFGKHLLELLAQDCQVDWSVAAEASSICIHCQASPFPSHVSRHRAAKLSNMTQNSWGFILTG